MKRIARVLSAAALCCFVLAGSAFAALAYPQPLFAYSVAERLLAADLTPAR